MQSTGRPRRRDGRARIAHADARVRVAVEELVDPVDLRGGVPDAAEVLVQLLPRDLAVAVLVKVAELRLLIRTGLSRLEPPEAQEAEADLGFLASFLGELS